MDSADLFWGRRPKILLQMIQMVFFAMSAQLAFIIFTAWEVRRAHTQTKKVADGAPVCFLSIHPVPRGVGEGYPKPHSTLNPE